MIGKLRLRRPNIVPQFLVVALLILSTLGSTILVASSRITILAGIVVAAVTFALDRLLRIPFNRWAPVIAFVWIPIIASAIGILAGWWAINYTMGGPVTT